MSSTVISQKIAVAAMSMRLRNLGVAMAEELDSEETTTWSVAGVAHMDPMAPG